MNSQLVVAVGLSFGIAILIWCVGVAIFGYSADKAEGIREAEAEDHVVVEEVRSLRIRRPEKFHHDRFDRHPFYLGANLSVWCYAWCILGGAPVTSNLNALTPQTKTTMAICFLVGSTLCLLGAAMGMKIFRWRFLEVIHDNVVAARLSDDIRLPYTFGIAGVGAVGVSMGIYASTSFHSTVGSLGGWLTALLGVGGCAFMFVAYLVRIRQYSVAKTILEAETKLSILSRRQSGDDHAD